MLCSMFLSLEIALMYIPSSSGKILSTYHHFLPSAVSVYSKVHEWSRWHCGWVVTLFMKMWGNDAIKITLGQIYCHSTFKRLPSCVFMAMMTSIIIVLFCCWLWKWPWCCWKNNFQVAWQFVPATQIWSGFLPENLLILVNLIVAI